ncbi:universal stress protein [Siculibacillus lacustris]|uniref:Universal stress protein n=1 Tax=Siculibacillus lacustris TaxID=1549641 RepID=A0A4Q9VNP6_9HYPH|nr:universal stress protein [Siculibacillus lacustris]TBW37199.1 universal stress protein [Siculibacillus lacustris]
MAIKDMLVLLDNGHATDDVRRGKPKAGAEATVPGIGPGPSLALDLAARLGAHATGVALAVDPIVPGFVVAPLPVEVIERARTQAVEAAQSAVTRFAEAARQSGVSAETRTAEILMGGAPEGFVAACRTTDLVVIGQDDPDRSEPMRDMMIEAALFEGTAPLLLVPYINRGGGGFRRVMIAWDGGRAASRAVHAALPLLVGAEKIAIVLVGRAGSASGQPGAELATWLARHDLDVEVTPIEAPDIPVADALLDHAADRSFDLLVMGGYGHSRVREFLLGGATRGILASMTLPVLMAH